jgi:outer membrane assembly lipoprotein YfiO
MPRTGWVFLAILVVISPVAKAADMVALAPTTWERGADGKWQQAGEPAPAAAPADQVVRNDTLDRVEALLAARKPKAARKPIIDWAKANPTAPDRDRGLFLLSEMYSQSGDKVRAFYHLDELMDFYPESRLFQPSLEKQFGIAERFLSGYKRRFLRIPLFTGEDEGIEILYRIQERAPGSPIAERALLRTADYYYDDSQFDLAALAYSSYARTYPRSPEVPRVRLRQAFSSLAQFRGLRFDATPVIDAKAQLEDIQAEYPELAQRENVADVLERIDGILAARVAQTADFYRRTNQPRAAAYNWRYLVDNFPETVEADRAQRQLERAPAWALELPAPVGGRAVEEEQLRTPSPAAPAPTGTATDPLKPAAADDTKTGDTIPPSIDTPTRGNP